jgi:SAM-dependent methyltransferase
VIPDEQFADIGEPEVSFAYQRRESLFCRSCGSSLRVRGFADVLLSLYGQGASSFAELIEQEGFRQLDIAEINTIGSVGSLHAFLVQLPKLSLSEYRGPDHLGEVVDGARNEDICRLTYDDESFDLVISSDTLEHVPDFRAALRETRRVLRRGGRHIFTVPVVNSRARTFPRVDIGPDGRLVYLLPPLHHGRGRGLFRYLPAGGDLLTFTEFGRDLPDLMREAGFDPVIFPGPNAAETTGASFVYSGAVLGSDLRK